MDNTLNNSTFERLNDLNSFDEYQVGVTQNTSIGRWSRYRPLGAKHYELSNHLGNVLATVSAPTKAQNFFKTFLSLPI